MSADSLDAFQTRHQILTGPKAVRDRDMNMPEFARTVKKTERDNNYRLWTNPKRPAQAPDFKPNGSFAPLTSGGKVQVGDGQQVRQQEKKYMVPGYTGYIPHSQHSSGRRYSEVTRRAFNVSLVDHVTQENIPSDPQNNMRIPQLPLEDRFMYGVTQNKLYNVPGYTGHVPGTRHTYAQTYGVCTRDGWERHHQNFPNEPQERPGYAYTLKQRKPNQIDSAPLPGQNASTVPPKFCVPRKLDHVQYFAL